MSCHLLDLPQELHLEITGYLSSPLRRCKALLQLSSTCHFFRNLLGPRIFQEVRIYDDGRSAESVLAVAESPHCRSVEKLLLAGRESSPPEFEELPDATYLLLSDLDQFPRLQALTISYPSEAIYDQLLTDDFEMFRKVETTEDIVAAESVKGWRTFLNQLLHGTCAK